MDKRKFIYTPFKNGKEAANWIRNELFIDFPFDGNSDIAHAFAMMILPFCVDLIEGRTPLFEVSATSPGTGKGLLSDVCFFPSEPAEKLTPTDDNEEMRKRLTTLLMNSCEKAIIDNVESIDSSVLAMFITATTWTDRILGGNTSATIDNNMILAVTGTNIAMHEEIARRVCRMRLVARTDRPWLSGEYKHSNLMHFMIENRNTIVSAVLTMIEDWIRKGKKPFSGKEYLGGFESWTSVTGGILENADINGFLGNLIELYDSADTNAEPWRDFCFHWYEQYSTSPQRASSLFKIAQNIDGIDFGNGAERAQKIAFGKLLSKNRDRIFDDYQIVFAGKAQRISLWKLKRLEKCM
jgi:hypothetical protein